MFHTTRKKPESSSLVLKRQFSTDALLGGGICVGGDIYMSEVLVLCLSIQMVPIEG